MHKDKQVSHSDTLLHHTLYTSSVPIYWPRHNGIVPEMMMGHRIKLSTDRREREEFEVDLTGTATAVALETFQMRQLSLANQTI
jgi:hypothetical protein